VKIFFRRIQSSQQCKEYKRLLRDVIEFRDYLQNEEKYFDSNFFGKKTQLVLSRFHVSGIVLIYQFRQAKFANASQFLLVPQKPSAHRLAIKVVNLTLI
jgi:hypothetical protein